ncbi:MAG: hypothetical protein ACI4XA_04145 [Oscillospiraceae bacterium]
MNIIDLSGKWDVFLDESRQDAIPAEFDGEITLPDTTSHARLGRLNTEKNYGCLTDLYKFEGYAWFRRRFSISEEQAAGELTLLLERTRKTSVYIDGRNIGQFCSLCAPHRYDLGGISAGEHEIIVRVDNTDYPTAGGHLTSVDTQTNWNGITGKLEIQCYRAFPRFVSVFPDIKDKKLRVRADIAGRQSGSALLKVLDENGEYGAASFDFSEGKLDCTMQLSGNVPLWSEHSPALLRLEINIDGDSRRVNFGMRELRTDGLKFRINGDETFLRGKHDGLVFPLTGFAPTDTASWIKVFETAKRYGINHYRFHTCCPPEAAFEAADLMGIYMQPELPFWGTIPDELNNEHRFLREEGFRILREYGSHASFVMMSMGNELWGNQQRLDEILAGYKEIAPDKLYVQGSNNFQFVPCILEHDDFFSGVRFDRDRLIRGSYASCDAPFGHIQTDEPNSAHNYDSIIIPENAGRGSDGGEILIQYGTEMKKVRADSSGAIIPNVPVVSHEVGQYYIYPNYDEIAKYTGSLRHDTYEGYRAAAKEKGLLSHWRDFFRASGALSAACYRDEIETALRSEKMAGFQLLDLQDFPGQGTATVGILDPFMESKGLIEPNEWRHFCSKTVVLAELPRFIYTSGEKVTCGLMISSTEPHYSASKINWTLTVGGKTVADGASSVGTPNGRIFRCAPAVFTPETDAPCTAVLSLRVDGTNITNSYTLYIYPETDVEITETYIKYDGKTLPIVNDISAANEKTLCIPKAGENDLRGEYCTDFWCYGMFRSISESMGKPVPTGTLGLFINKDSALLGGFPCEEHTTPQWYGLVTHSHCANLDGTDIEPDVWVIDNPQRASRLALLYRDNGRTVCTSRLWEIADRVEVRHFAASLVKAVLG